MKIKKTSWLYRFVNMCDRSDQIYSLSDFVGVCMMYTMIGYIFGILFSLIVTVIFELWQHPFVVFMIIPGAFIYSLPWVAGNIRKIDWDQEVDYE